MDSSVIYELWVIDGHQKSPMNLMCSFQSLFPPLNGTSLQLFHKIFSEKLARRQSKQSMVIGRYFYWNCKTKSTIPTAVSLRHTARVGDRRPRGGCVLEVPRYPRVKRRVFLAPHKRSTQQLASRQTFDFICETFLNSHSHISHTSSCSRVWFMFWFRNERQI